jgi:DNA-binding NtrC family response regulator
MGLVTRRILIVDDDLAHREAIRDYLVARYSDQDYAIDSAANGDEAARAILRARPDVVLLDVAMPGMSGIDVLKLIRSADPTIAVVMLTGQTDARVAGESLKLGAFAYAPKPVNFLYLDHLLATALDRPSGRRPV